MHQPSNVHWSAIKQILQYLKGSVSHGLIYWPGPNIIQAYCDADYAGNPDDRHLTGGYVVYFLILSLGVLRNNALFPVLALRLSIFNLHIPLLMYHGFGPYLRILVLASIPLSCGMIILAPYLWHPTLFIMPKPNIWRLIIITFMRKWFVKN